MSTPFSSARRRALGEEKTRSPGACSTTGCGAGAASAVGASGAAAAGAAAGASPPSRAEMSSPGWPTMAMGWVMGTVSPSGCRIFSTVPVAVESMVMVSLSVSISKRGAPSVVCSPSFASHLVMVPSSIKRPCLGMIMTEAMSSAPFSAVQGRLAGVHDILHAGQHRLFQPQVKGKGAASR